MNVSDKNRFIWHVFSVKIFTEIYILRYKMENICYNGLRFRQAAEFYLDSVLIEEISK